MGMKKSGRRRTARGGRPRGAAAESPQPKPLGEYQEKRDFTRTSEPAGVGVRARRRAEALRSFVIQKHAARRTHFDLRLEWGGVLKSWAVPKGPSLDPKEKRLAVPVEDHPLEYGSFEGRIPQGEYGAGPVIIWDRGRYVPYYPSEQATDEELEEWYRKGKVEFELFGERLRGKWGLIRIRGSGPRDAEGKEPWLLIKKKDEHAAADRDVVAEYQTSVVSGRNLQEIDEVGDSAPSAPGAVAADAPDFQPMLAERADQLPDGAGWLFEPKVDGIRVIARIAPGEVRLLSRTGQRLESAFPEVARALARFGARVGATMVLDGELGVRAADGVVRFEAIQPRINLKSPSEIEVWARKAPAEFFAFDCLWADGLRFADRLLRERKEALHALLRLAEGELQELPWWVSDGGEGATGEEALRRAQEEGWEGLVAKRLDSRYQSGRRSRSWLKVKLQNQEEFVVVGWTDPAGSRVGFGALLLAYYDAGGQLRFAGRAGTGFSADDLAAIAGLLSDLARDGSPCADGPQGPEYHWVEPRLVAMVKFQEWTRDGRLRAPVFLGLRRDKAAEQVRLSRPPGAAVGAELGPPLSAEVDDLLADLERMESEGQELRATINGVELTFTNLHKVLWPEDGITKGELLRYYARISPWLLPALADRPLHMQRYPNGIDEEAFWQQRAPDPLPAGLRTVSVEDEEETVDRLVGGSLAALLYMAQLAAITQHPWHSRMDSLEFADYAILDLDPGPEVPFPVVRDVARWVRDEVERLQLVAFLKSSGGRGLHVFLPLGPGTPYATGRLLTQLVAALVVKRHRARATVERSLKKRPRNKVYLDCFQNEFGKTIASVYSVRPRPGAPVSVPLRWEELDADFDPQDFRLRDVWERFQSVEDLWDGMRRQANSVEEVIERVERARSQRDRST